MIKKILAVTFIFLIKINYSQETSASPYSVYGFGENRFKGSGDLFQMGGNSVISDSIYFNVNNPASNGGQLLTSFSVGGTSKFLSLATSTENQKAKKTTFDYIYLTLPLSKSTGVTLGVIQQFGSGYRIFQDTRNTNDIYKRFRGSGGLNKVFLSGGYKSKIGLSIGGQIDYYFGSYENSVIIGNRNLLNATFESNEATLRGLGLGTSIIYRKKIKDLTFSSTLLYNLQSTIGVELKRNTALVTYNFQDDVSNQVSEGVVVSFPNINSTLPSKLTFGIGVGSKKWAIGTDYSVISAGNQVNFFQTINTTNFESGSRFTLGGHYTPKVDNYAKYYERITYRAGIRYDDTGLKINNKKINDFAFSFGMGLPFSGTMLNVGMDIGRRGTKNANLIEENYFSVNIGLYLLDKWFRKTYID